MYHTYLLTGKDRNLNGTLLALESHASQLCGEPDDIWGTITKSEWQWHGPEVSRTYPTDPEIERIPPDAKGFRRVPYRVHLTYRDPRGGVAKVEDYAAWYLDGPPFNGRAGKR